MKVYRCQHCRFMVTANRASRGNKSAKYKMGHHYEATHKHLIPSDMTGYQWFYYLLTKRNKGSCVICKTDTMFNEAAMKYSRFCENPSCKQKYKEEFRNRMIGRYGKIHLLNDPEKQKEMLSKRKISGEYLWSDKSTRIGYTGSYELHFLKFLDIEIGWKSSDIISPSPHTYRYEYGGTEHFYIPDFFIPSISLEIEIKDGGSAINIDQDVRNKSICKDNVMRSNANNFNYVRILDKDYSEFLTLVKEE